MCTIELFGNVDDQHRLLVQVPDAVRPGPVKVLLEIPDDSDDWAQGVAAIWAADWSDPREDIYTLEDGKPENEPR